jgi:hypothetical protein
MVSPRQRRAAVAWAQTAYRVSQRRACRASDVGRAAVRYQPQRDPATALRRRLHELATTRLTFGSLRLHLLLRRVPGTGELGIPIDPAARCLGWLARSWVCYILRSLFAL